MILLTGEAGFIGTLAAKEILCLPIYPALDVQEQQRIIDLVHRAALLGTRKG